MLSLIRWMRRYNSEPRHAKKLSSQRFDMQFTPIALRRVHAYLTGADPERARWLRASTRALSSEFNAMNYNVLPKDIQETTAEGIRELARQLDQNKATYVQRAGDQAWSVARHHARILEQAQILRAASR